VYASGAAVPRFAEYGFLEYIAPLDLPEEFVELRADPWPDTPRTPGFAIAREAHVKHVIKTIASRIIEFSAKTAIT
jgi:hypothetical protein